MCFNFGKITDRYSASRLSENSKSVRETVHQLSCSVSPGTGIYLYVKLFYPSFQSLVCHFSLYTASRIRSCFWKLSTGDPSFFYNILQRGTTVFQESNCVYDCFQFPWRRSILILGIWKCCALFFSNCLQFTLHSWGAWSFILSLLPNRLIFFVVSLCRNAFKEGSTICLRQITGS